MTHRIFFQFCVSGVASLCISMTALAQPCAELPLSRTVSDQKGGCLALVPIGPTASSSKILIVMLHGDGGGQLSQAQITRWTRLGETLQAPDRNVFFMLRPGYQSPAGNSSGWANPRDDDYTALNMERVAGALRTLRDSYKSEKLILVGHSGGAATSSIVLGKHPGVADAALLLGCPCDVPPWRDHRNAQRGATGGWPRSLNPLEFIAGIPVGTPVLAATGAQDENTLPTFARRWVDAANAKNAKARFVEIPGLSHSTILQWPDIGSSISELVEATKR